MKYLFCLCSALVLTCNGFAAEAVQEQMVFISGQFPINLTTGKLVQGSMQDLTNQTLANLTHDLHAHGCTLNDVVKTQIYLIDIRDYEAMNQAYVQHFHTLPAQDVIQVAGLQYGSRIEISCIAVK